MTSQIVRYVCYYGSSKQSGGGQAYISQKHLGSDIIIICLADTSIFVGQNVPNFMEKKARPKRIMAEMSRDHVTDLEICVRGGHIHF